MREINRFEHYHLLADILRYPTESLFEDTILCMAMLKTNYPQAASELQRFADFVADTSLTDIEEVYTKTFHIQAICYLDLGYVLFGEDYKRGEFLSNMKREQEQVNNDCGVELADNLMNVLTLFPKLSDEDFINELGVRVVIPSLKNMLNEFKSARIELKNKVMRKKHRAILQEDLVNGNIYQNVLKALLIVFEQDFVNINYEGSSSELPDQSHSFITNCSLCSTVNVDNDKKQVL